MKPYEEELVDFTNCDSQRLFGVVTLPAEDSNANGIGLIFPNGGVMSREGHYRIHTRTARFLAAHGYHSLRFNPHGLGNSEGHIEDGAFRSLFGKIQSGLFIVDVQSAVHYVRKHYPIEKVVLFGVCGGAISNLLTINIEKAIDGMILLSIPIMLDNPAIDYVARSMRSAEPAKRELEIHLRKLKALRSWVRFLTFQSDYARVWKVVVANVRQMLRQPDNDRSLDPVGDPAGAAQEWGRPSPNRLFFSSCQACFENGTRLLFIFGENDYFKNEFMESAHVRRMLDAHREGVDYRIEIVKNANHVYTWIEFQREAMACSLSWLNQSIRAHDAP